MNDWNGTITKQMFDLSQVESNYETFANLTKKYLLNCLVGNAHLTGEGALLEYFDEIIEEAIERGEIAIIEVGKQKLLAIPKLIQQTLLKEKVEGEKGSEPIEPVVSYEFTLLENSNLTYQSKDLTKWVIFKFNKEATPILKGLDFWTKRLVNILTQMEKEIFMNEKGIMVTLPQWPDDADVSLIMKSFSKKPFFFMCLPKSQEGDKGKLGIAPHQIKTEFYEPKEFHEEKYRSQFAFVWTNMERAYGIRHDTLENKEERASVSEVFSSQANFDAQEKKIYRLLWKSIREYNRVFEEGKGNYNFKFGRIGG
ncbi:hypothetical protein [endosymbiont GvMRE of Glomus versiforme]|uniref:hypothetical protein n=1 Tax=endosymbiont GvMRE of Glomus versiforme TaxID=2039283 RepID=UPI000EBCDD83|nr:hypothetical protein [endosymbiont GvMRE of Glomus versiforme]RHZ37693.1 hypothetical protein GvMRE_I1g699 [endosymbiont GvMRE of Glomus versiforme]